MNVLSTYMLVGPLATMQGVTDGKYLGFGCIRIRRADSW